METHYSSEKNVQILIALLKELGEAVLLQVDLHVLKLDAHIRGPLDEAGGNSLLLRANFLKVRRKSCLFVVNSFLFCYFWHNF